MRGRNSFLAREAEDFKMHASSLPKEICPAIFSQFLTHLTHSILPIFSLLRYFLVVVVVVTV